LTGNRDVRIDSLRVLALCVITLTHLKFPALLWAWNALGHMSFAEVFVFISGLVSGIVYWKLQERTSNRAV
jgi:hypothetical protein